MHATLDAVGSALDTQAAEDGPAISSGELHAPTSQSRESTRPASLPSGGLAPIRESRVLSQGQLQPAQPLEDAEGPENAESAGSAESESSSSAGPGTARSGLGTARSGSAGDSEVQPGPPAPARPSAAGARTSTAPRPSGLAPTAASLEPPLSAVTGGTSDRSSSVSQAGRPDRPSHVAGDVSGHVSTRQSSSSDSDGSSK